MVLPNFEAVGCGFTYRAIHGNLHDFSILGYYASQVLGASGFSGFLVSAINIPHRALYLIPPALQELNADPDYLGAAFFATEVGLGLLPCF